jgi:predicted nucleic acid binding AN1-type Zn finger protein
MDKKCQIDKCKVKPSITGIGFCRNCKKNFCNSHRFTEKHNCLNLHTMIENYREKLGKKLLSETCVTQKITQI